MNYLFVGEDEFSKDIKLQGIKQQLNLNRLEPFNFEVLYAKDLDLKTLRMRISTVPLSPVGGDSPGGKGISSGAKIKQRLILIKDALSLKADIKQYLLGFLQKPFPHVSLILDIRRIDRRQQFFNQIARLVQLINFRQSREIDAFMLARQIMQKKINPAMLLLHQLLLQGERPEKILGAIRYQLQQEKLDIQASRKKITFLLACDRDIKMEKLKPEFSLERLIIRLCYF